MSDLTVAKLHCAVCNDPPTYIVFDVLLFVFGQRYHHYTLFVLGCLEMLSETRGLTVHVWGDNATVDLTVL